MADSVCADLFAINSSARCDDWFSLGKDGSIVEKKQRRFHQQRFGFVCLNIALLWLPAVVCSRAPHIARLHQLISSQLQDNVVLRSS